MKLTEATNEEALDMLAEILEPANEIFTDTTLKAMAESGENQMKLIKYAIQNHKQSIIQILAVIDGVPVEEYKCNIFTLPMRLIEIMNDKDLAPFFRF